MNANDDTYDDEADATILRCLNLENPKSFFLYAGAGSGKTRSLVEAVRTVCRRQGRKLSLTGQKLGVITYTNSACDEIKQRLEFDPRVAVSTIHAFAWALIVGHDGDIREWLNAKLQQDIADLQIAQSKGRASSKAAADRTRAIETKQSRLAQLHAIKRFTYSPTGDNRTHDALSHAEVIAMTAGFLAVKPGLRRLLVTRFPILLIDESQDTNGSLLDSLLNVEAANSGTFCMGLFGDTMQRIYGDGKDRLVDAIPKTWARPRKRMNHRCPKRVIELINRIRRDVDSEEQVPRSDAAEGVVRLFVAPHATVDKAALETAAALKMAIVTCDKKWALGSQAIKTLALEHLMSARRFGFAEFFEPLYSVDRIRTSLLQGAGSAIGLFTREVLPTVAALRASDKFATAAIVRRTSPLLERNALKQAGGKQVDVLGKVNSICNGLLSLVTLNEKPSARTVLAYVAETGLFSIPDVLMPFASADEVAREGDIEEVRENAVNEDDSESRSELSGWRRALEAPFDQIEKYHRYVVGLSPFDTHQGVKGLEFPRVMVIVSDDEARGFMFAYDKLFGAKGKSETDIKNEAAGKETTIDRTRRLFYVTCSRAKESLAIVYYADNPRRALDAIIEKGWFAANETEICEE